METKYQSLPPLKRFTLQQQQQQQQQKQQDNKENDAPGVSLKHLPAKKRKESRDVFVSTASPATTAITTTYSLPAKKRIWALPPDLDFFSGKPLSPFDLNVEYKPTVAGFDLKGEECSGKGAAFVENKKHPVAIRVNDYRDIKKNPITIADSDLKDEEFSRKEVNFGENKENPVAIRVNDYREIKKNLIIIADSDLKDEEFSRKEANFGENKENPVAIRVNDYRENKKNPIAVADSDSKDEEFSRKEANFGEKKENPVAIRSTDFRENKEKSIAVADFYLKDEEISGKDANFGENKENPLVIGFDESFEGKAKIEESKNRIATDEECENEEEYHDDEGEDDGILCAICQSTDGDPKDPIVFCDGCDLMVHATCYGNPLINGIPECEWFCSRCLHSLSEKRKILPPCCLCQSATGALKQTNDGLWAHVVCALLVPEVFFLDPDGREGIDCSKVPNRRWEGKCYVCGSCKGCVIECSEPKCPLSFHVTCGLNEGLCIEYQERKRKNKEAIVAGFCKSHTELWEKQQQTGKFKIVARGEQHK